MFWDDVQLVAEMVAKYGARPPFVDVGGLEKPCVADYTRTIDAMAELREEYDDEPMPVDRVINAQRARYLDILRPLETSCPGYVCMNPETGGLGIERLAEKYPGTVGTAILLSVLEHVANPFECARALRGAMITNGLAIVSVPFAFPEHPSPRDLWRFTPDALREVFSPANGWDIHETGWRLDIPAEAGVIDLRTGRAQTIRSCYLVARSC